MLNNRKNQMKLLWIMIVILVVYGVFQGLLAISRIGENKLTIGVIPESVKITVNNKPIHGHAVYLSPGTYIVKVSKSGWETDTQSVKMGHGSVDIYSLPEPESNEAKTFASNPDVRRQREEIGSKLANSKGQQIENQNPLIKLLPYSDLTGPFTIDYGPSLNRPGGIYYRISNSSPSGRQNAIKWIKEHGQNPTNMEIIYANYNNPLGAGDSR